MIEIVALVVFGAALGWLVGRSMGRRSASASGRIEQPAARSSGAGEVDHEAGVDRQIMEAVENLSLGLVLHDLEGRQVFENATAGLLGQGRHQRPLVEAALAETAELTRQFGVAEHTLDLFGPPRQLLDFSGSTVHVADVAIGFAVIIEDVTEQRRSMDVRRDFVANVSHELKTPVGAMGLLAEALVDADDPEVTARLSARLHAEAIRLGNTIDDLLALSEIESGTLHAPGPVDPNTVVEAALERAQAAADLRDITLTIDNRIGGLIIEGDRRQLVAAVGNLLDNAVKYSEPGSGVSIVVAGAADEDRFDAGALLIEIIDQGVGIPPIDRERIFERFYRVDQARSRATGGTGLGLSIVRNVARNHGGHVELESVEGEGSTFRLILPLLQPIADEDDEDDDAPSAVEPAAGGDGVSPRPAAPPARMASAARSGSTGPRPSRRPDVAERDVEVSSRTPEVREP